MEESIKKLETALRLIMERRQDVAGLGASIQLISDVIDTLRKEADYFSKDR